MLEKIRPYLPSKKILLLLGGCVFIVGAIIIITNFDQFKTFVSVKQAKKDLGTSSVTEFVKEDEDGDGIPNWEEPLWGTDPANPDSDNDGIPDAEEIEQKRKEIQNKTNIDPSSTDELSETEAFAREFFGIVASLSAQGTLTDEALANLSQEFVNKTLSPSVLLSPYKQADLTTTYLNTDESRLNYYNDLKKVLDPYLNTQMGLELQVIASGIYLNDNTRIKNLSVPAATYSEIATKLLSVKVPLEAATRHLALVNGFALLGTSLNQTTSILEDPVVGIAGLVAYKTTLDTLLESITDIDLYFESHGIL